MYLQITIRGEGRKAGVKQVAWLADPRAAVLVAPRSLKAVVVGAVVVGAVVVGVVVVGT